MDWHVAMTNKERTKEAIEQITTIKELQVWKKLKELMGPECVGKIRQYLSGSTNILKRGNNWYCGECMKNEEEKWPTTNYCCYLCYITVNKQKKRAKKGDFDYLEFGSVGGDDSETCTIDGSPCPPGGIRCDW